MLRNNFLATLMLIGMVTGCVSSVEQLRKSDLKGNTYQTLLAKQYLVFAESEADQYDWFNSAYFAKKGLKSINGEEIAPEKLEDWSLPEDMLPIMQQAREYLVSVITVPETTKDFPEQSANAQFYFDCWVEQQEENWQEEDIAKCREGFYDTLDKLFVATTNTKLPERPVLPESIRNIGKQETRLAYFKIGSSALDGGAKRLISSVISRLKDAKSYDIMLNGYADNVGSEESNMKLSKSRAMAIKKALVDGGLNEKSITIFAFGDTQGRVETKKGVASKENRVVEIVLDAK